MRYKNRQQIISRLLRLPDHKLIAIHKKLSSKYKPFYSLLPYINKVHTTEAEDAIFQATQFNGFIDVIEEELERWEKKSAWK